MRVPRETVEKWNQLRKGLLTKRATMNPLRHDLIRLASSQPVGSPFRKKLLAAVADKAAYETGETERDGWNPGAVVPRDWPAGEGSTMPPERDLQGLQVDQREFNEGHYAKSAQLRGEIIRLAASQPKGSSARRELLALLTVVAV